MRTIVALGAAFGVAAAVGVAAPARAGGTERVSVATGGGQVDGGDTFDGLSISADGRFVAFASEAGNLVPGDTNGLGDLFVRDLRAGTTRRVSLGTRGAQADSASFAPSISADGRFVALRVTSNSSQTSHCPSLSGFMTCVFVHDRGPADN
jgi:Tol biopolymer transport system component